MCVDQLRAKGDVLVVLCKEDTRLRFFDKEDLSEITYMGIAYGGHWINHGDHGFDLVQNGNSYIVFFTAYQQGAEDECPFGTPEGSTIIFNVSFASSFFLNLPQSSQRLPTNSLLPLLNHFLWFLSSLEAQSKT